MSCATARNTGRSILGDRLPIRPLASYHNAVRLVPAAGRFLCERSVIVVRLGKAPQSERPRSQRPKATARRLSARRGRRTVPTQDQQPCRYFPRPCDITSARDRRVGHSCVAPRHHRLARSPVAGGARLPDRRESLPPAAGRSPTTAVHRRGPTATRLTADYPFTVIEPLRRRRSTRFLDAPQYRAAILARTTFLAGDRILRANDP